MWGQRQDGQSEWRCQSRKCHSCDRNKIQIDQGAQDNWNRIIPITALRKKLPRYIVGLVGKNLNKTVESGEVLYDWRVANIKLVFKRKRKKGQLGKWRLADLILALCKALE